MLFAVTVQAGCGDCGGCSSGSGCVTDCGGVAADCGTGCGPACETRTVMQSQYVTETRMVPQTTYQR
ncbi:MAG: hypothetical protein ACR2NZ_23530, partial [Rubripirellula sp.]